MGITVSVATLSCISISCSVGATLTEDLAVLLVEGLKIATLQCLADLAGEVIVEVQVMGDGQTHTQRLLGLDEVADIGAAVVAAGGAVAGQADGAGILHVLLVEKVDLPFPSEQVAVAGVSRGHDAVEKVHAHVDGLQNIARSTHAHEVAGLILGHMRLHGVDDAVHLLGGLTDRQTADGVALAGDLGDLMHMLDTEILVGTALVDAEEHLVAVDGLGEAVEAVHLGAATLQPADGAGAGLLDVLVGGGVLDALVEGHGYGGGQVRLDLHTLLGAHEDALAVHMGGELHALLGDLAEGGQGEDLKSAAVGEDGFGPIHELVEAAHVVDELVAGADVEVVGVGELDLAVNVIQELHGGYAALDSGAGAHVHENGGLDVTVNGVEHASAGASVGCENRKHRFLFLGLSQCNVRPVVI